MTPPAPEEQISAHLAALEAAPADDAAFRALEDLYEKYDRWEDLVALYEGRAHQGAGDGASGFLAKAAELAQRRMRNTARAEELWRQVLHADPRHPSALVSMREIYEQRADWPALADALERQADRASEPRTAAVLYLELGRVWEERLQRQDRAALFYARAARIDPAHAGAREAALRSNLALRRWNQAKRALDEARAEGADPKALAAEYARLGALLVDEPLDHALAAEALADALQLDRAAPGATEAQARLEAVRLGWRSEAQALVEEASRAKERRAASRLCLRAAALHAAYEPEAVARVVELAERALLLAPSSDAALDLIERWMGGREDWRGLERVLQRLSGALRDRVALAGIHLRQARLDLVRFGDAAQALEALSRALALDPASEPAAQQAFELHVEAGHPADALEVLEKHLGAAREGPQHVAWRLRAADLALGLGDEPRARAHLEAALRADPRSPEVAAALAPILERAGAWPRLAAALEAQIASERDAVARAQLLERLAEVQATRLGAPREALRRLAQALLLDPGRASLRRAIDAAAAQADLFPELARAYREGAGSPAADARARKALLRRAAEVWDRDLGKPEQALEAWRELVALDPEDAGAHAALEACLVKAGRLEEIAEELRGRIAAADGAAKRELLVKLARVHEEAGDHAGAARAFREAVDAGEETVPVLRGLVAALEALGPSRAEERLDALSRLAAQLDGAGRAAVELERASLLAGALGRPAEAAGVLLAALRGGSLPVNQLGEAVRRLEELLARGVEPIAIARALVPVYAGQREAAKQVAVLEFLGRSLPQGTDPRERARLLLDAAAVRAERLSDRRGALSAASAALRACPAHAEARRAAERLAREVGALPELYALFCEAAARLEGAPDDERALRTRAAQIAEEDLGNAEEATAQLRRALALAPGDPAVLAALTRVALGAERWEEAAELLADRIARTSGAERAALLAQLAGIVQERLGRPADAARTWREALAASGPDARPRVLARLAAALGAAGDAAGEAAALEELSRIAADPAEAAAAARRRARLQVERLGEPLAAIEHYRAALVARPDDADAHAALTELLAGEAAVARAAADALLAAAEVAGEPRKVIAALEAVAARAPDAASRAAAERRAAQLWGDALGQWSLAFAALLRAVRATPRDGDLRRELREAAARAGTDVECARAYEQLLEAPPDGLAPTLWRELARLEEERLGDAGAAAAAWVRALALAPGDPESLAALLRLHRAAGRRDDVVATALALAESAAPAPARAEALREAARALDGRPGGEARAVDAWARLATLLPEDAEAEGALARLCRELDRPADLAALLERRRARPGGEADAELALELAELKRARLGQPGEALTLVAGVLRADPTRTAATVALVALAAVPGPVGREALALCDALLRPLAQHAARASAREKRLAAVDDPAERASLHAEIRAIYERDLGRPELAFASAARAFSEGGLAGEDAAADLERLAAAAGALDGLAQAYEAAAAAATGPEPARALRRRAARVREEHIPDPQGAIAAWGRVLEGVPDDAEALAALTRLYARAREAAKLADVARRRAALASGEERAAVLAELAELEEGVGDGASAIAAAEEALAVDRGSTRALALLARLYRQGGRVEDLARVLRAQAAAEHDDLADREALLLERAQLLEGVGDGRLALDAYADILAENPRHPRALEGLERLLAREAVRDAASRALEDVFRAAGDARRLVALLEARLASADASERAPLFAEIAALHERMGDRGAAFRARARQLAEAVSPGADDPALRAELERLAAAASAWDPLAQAFEELLQRGVPALARTEVLRRLAGIHADQLGRPELAARWLAELAEGGDPGALAALARVHRQAGAHRELAAALRRQAEVVPEPERKKELLLEVARIMAENLSDREGAIDAYRHILNVDPEDPNALRLLGRLLGGAERWDELVDVLGREVALAEKRPNLAAEAAELRFRLGRIRQQRLADVAGALQCYRGVLDKVPRHPAALAALEELARAGGDGAVEAATLLEPVYEQEGEHAKLVQTLEARAAAAPDAASRALILRHMAEVQAGPMKSPEAGFLTAARALRDDPDDAESIALAGRLADAAGLHEELAALLAEVADRLRDPRARLELRRRIARLAAPRDTRLALPGDTRLVAPGDARRAGDAWARVLEVAPDDAEALEGLTAALRSSGEGDLLAHVLRRRIASEDDPGARVALLAELAQVQEERQKDLAGAAATLRRLLEVDPGRRDALARLDRLCVELEKWVELADVLAREVGVADAAGDAAQAGAMRQRLAELKESRLLDKEGALALYEEILAARPEDAQALGRVEALLAKDPGNAHAAAALERAYAASGAWERYAAVLEMRAGERPDPMERKALLLELAEVQEQRLKSPERAFLALCRAFRDDPGDPALRGSLERLGEATGHPEELAAIYEEEFGELPPSAAAEAALVLGRLHEERLGSPESAVTWFERARELDLAGASPALAALDRLYRKLNRERDLARVLEAESEQASGDDRATFLFRLGQLAEEKLADPARAIRAYEALVAEDPRQSAALRALERLYEAGRHLDALARNLAAQRDLAADAPTRLRLTARLAATSQALGRDEDAAVLWAEALALDPRHEPALAALEGLYEKLGRWPELAAHLRARLAVTSDRREAARLHDKLGTLLGTRLGDAAEAVRSYLAVLDADPRNRKALEALRGLYAAQGDLDGLASVHRRLLPLQEDAGGVKAVRLELADVLLKAGKKSEAVEQGKRALELEPHSAEELARMAALFEAAGAPQERVKAVEARAALFAAGGRSSEAVEAWLAAADAWEKPLARPGSAAQALEKVLELEPARRDAWERLRAIYAKAGSWRDYVRVCDAFTVHLTDRDEKVALLGELARIHEEKLGQKDMAFLTLCRAFHASAGDPAVAAEAARLAAETEAFEELAAVYEEIADEAKGQGRARLLIELGRLRDSRLDDADGAEAAFRRALELDPASSDALDALTGLFTRRGRVRDLVITLEQKLEAAAGLDEKKATLLEMARIYDGQLHDGAEAIAALKRVLELDGADQAALTALADLYRREGRFGDLAGILARARDLAQDDAARLGYQLQVASLHENELSDDEGAVEAYRAALGLDDTNRDALAGLERLYTKLDRFAELNRVYERQAELARDPRERVRILAKSASIWEEKLGNIPKAIERNEQVLALDGGNLASLKALEGLYRREGRWEKLIAVLQHHASLTQDRRELVSLEVQVGEVWWKELARGDRAEAILTHALSVDADAREAVSALARLYEKSANWNLALELLQREAKLAASSQDAVDIQARIGRIQEEMLQDRSGAKIAYARALDVDPGHLPSLRALRAIAEAERDREAYLRWLLAEARYAEDDAAKAKLLHEAGRIHQEERDDPDGAVRLYEEALKKVPDFLPAARPLADLYVARADWPRAEGVLDVVVKRLAQEGDAKELCRQSYRLGHVAEKLGKKQKALECQRRAYELDATYLPALEALGHLLVDENAAEEALRIYQAILIHHRDGLTDLEVVEIYWQIGDLQTKLGQADRAAKSFEKALEIDGGHERSRRSLVAVLEAQGDFEAALEHRQRLVTQLAGEAKVEMYLAIGELCRDRLKDPYQAIDAFTGAARLDPGHLQATEALLGLYRETKQGQKAADVLSRLIETPEAKADPQRAAKLQHSLAVTLRDELGDEAGAARAFEAALDSDPRFVQAFADLEALLTRGKRWRELESAYLRMVQRLPKGPESSAARVALWKALGELYRRVLDDADKARMAYEVVARADPHDVAAVEAHAELAGRVAGHEAEAIAAWRQLMRSGGPAQKAASALVALHAQQKQYDLAYSAAQALVFLVGAATPEEGQVVSRLRRFARDTASGALDDAAWVNRVLHEKARGPLAAILALLTRQASDLFVQAPKDLGLNPKKDEVDVQVSMLFFVNMYKYVARALGLAAPPRLFRSAQEGARLQAAPLSPPALVAGEELFRERPKKELWFVIGKAMAFLRPELLLARLMPHDQLDALFQAAASLGTSRFVVTADPHLVQKLKHRLEKSLPDETRTQTLKKLARAYCDVQHPGDVRAYMDAAELTSNRVGALLAGDLDVVRRMVVAEKAAVSKLKEERRLQDLVLFCTSEDYAALRAQLGLSVVVPS